MWVQARGERRSSRAACVARTVVVLELDPKAPQLEYVGHEAPEELLGGVYAAWKHRREAHLVYQNEYDVGATLGLCCGSRGGLEEPKVGQQAAPNHCSALLEEVASVHDLSLNNVFGDAAA